MTQAGVPTPFIHLHTHSAYSLAEGAIGVKDLVKICRKRAMPAVAITDTGNLFGGMEFAIEAAKAGIQPILGCQMRLGESLSEIVLLVRSVQGYRNLCALVTASFLETVPPQDPHISWDHLGRYADGLICLTGGLHGVLTRSLLGNQTAQAESDLQALKTLFGDALYIEIQRHETQAYGWADEGRAESGLIDLAMRHGVPLVATNDCYFMEPDMAAAHDALLCIAGGRYISEEDRRRLTPEHYFKSGSEMRALFADLPEAIDNTAQIARRCHFLLEPVDPILPPFETQGGRPEIEELRDQARKGLEWRLAHFVSGSADPAPYRERLDFELDVIVQMGFAGYFLIVSDFIRWAKDQRIPVGPGRGSGAGSVVAWSLKITDLDPLRFGLLFERFLNPERVSMPDFDVDFCQDRRDEVIRYVRDRYGADKVAQIITFGKLQARAVLRDVGRVLQMSYGQVDRIAKMIPNNPADPVTLEKALEQDADLRAEKDKDETTRRLVDIALQLEGLYRHASTHAAGVVIGDRPLQELLALYRDPRSDIPATQFNMKYVEQSGLVKFDFLGLKTMTVIQKTVDMIAERGETLDYLKIPLDDPKTFTLLCEGRTVGVFQLESAGMRDTLRRMKPDRFEDIIALVALYRPGPMDNIPVYIDRKEGREAPDYLHPVLKPILEETYGIMIYQEQVMQCAQELAGYTLGGADLLRRAMGKKIKEAMDAEREKFVQGAHAHNAVPRAQAESIFEQIAKFAGYGFNKSHAAAYALIAYWTAWLKANHPLEFMAASMTLDLNNTDKLAVFRQDLLRMGVALLCPDINRSWPEFKVEGDSIRYALAALKGVGEQAMVSLIAERVRGGAFRSMADFAERVEPRTLNRRQIEQLIAAGAFDSFDPHRARLRAGIDILLSHAASRAHERDTGQSSLFDVGGSKEEDSGLRMPEFPATPYWDPLEKLKHEFDAVGFYLSAHPLDTRHAQLERLGISTMRDVQQALSYKSAGRFRMAAVLLKKQEKFSQKTGNKFAFVQLSDPAGVYEAMLFSETLARCRSVLEAGQALILSVDAERQEDQIRFTVQNAEKLEDALESSLREVHVHLASEAPLSALHRILTDHPSAGKEKGDIRILLKLDISRTPDAVCRHIWMELPDRWHFPPESRQTLWREEGVVDIREV